MYYIWKNKTIHNTLYCKSKIDYYLILFNMIAILPRSNFISKSIVILRTSH